MVVVLKLVEMTRICYAGGVGRTVNFGDQSSQARDVHAPAEHLQNNSV